MKKAGLITIAIILLAAGAVIYYRTDLNRVKKPADMGKGTLVKEHIEWKKYYL